VTERLAQVEARIASIGELHEIVSAMRALAAVRSQQASDKLAGIRSYAAIIAEALSRVLTLMPDDPHAGLDAAPRAGTAAALLVFTGEHGFSGNYNERLIARAGEIAQEGRQLFIVGARGALLASEHQLDVAWSTGMVTQIASVGAAARRVATEIYRRFSAGRLHDVDVIYGRGTSQGTIDIVRRSLLPLDLDVFRQARRDQPPLVNLEPRVLLNNLVGDYVHAELTLAAMECMASDNIARLMTMQSARHNIEEMLDGLTGQARQTRQTEITSEILEVVTGAKAALRDRARPSSSRSW
jgi:F-type H+-transporting ATPase subunit gamma